MSQHEDEEAKFLEELIPFSKNQNFIEIGFHFRQFNSVRLIKNNLKGKLIDTSKFDFLNILISKFIFKILKKDIKIFDYYVTPKNIGKVITDHDLGFLSIDIDGNDYWILSEILKKQIFPEIIILEYNSSFLHNSITVPYIENFDDYTFIERQCYFGASLTAFEKLLSKNGYSLIKCIAGVNAIFVNQGIIDQKNFQKISAIDINQECEARNKKLKKTSKEQYDLIKHLPLVKV